jgi:hypothetical protein
MMFITVHGLRAACNELKVKRMYLQTDWLGVTGRSTVRLYKERPYSSR